MMSYEFKGGTGTSSRKIQIAEKDYIVASLVQSNFGLRDELNILGVPCRRAYYAKRFCFRIDWP